MNYKKSKRALMGEAIMALGGPVAASKEQTIALFKEMNPDIKDVSDKTFYLVRRELAKVNEIADRPKDSQPIAGSNKLQPSQLVRTIRKLVELYGKEELKDLINELS